MCVPALGTICEETSDAIDNGDDSVKREKRNTLKMWTYLAFQLLEAFENDVTRPGVMAVQEKVCNCFKFNCTFDCVGTSCSSSIGHLLAGTVQHKCTVKPA